MSICSAATAYAGAWTANGFCAGTVPVPLDVPRSIQAVGATNFVVLERTTNSVVIIEDLNFDGIPESYRKLVTFPLLNHGFTFSSTHLYASTLNDVYRWTYDFNAQNVTSSEEKVITNINLDAQGLPDTETLYVHVGAVENLDTDSYRSRIRRFPLPSNAATTTLFPIDFKDGEVFADGIRNEVAMEFSPKDGHLWGAMNSVNFLYRTDLGGPIVYQNNPAEELHRFEAGQNYGYPYCWREYTLPRFIGFGRGTAWSFSSSGVADRACRNDYDRPIMMLPAHSAPLGLTFYDFKEVRPSECAGVIPFPKEMDGFLFIAYHGSWNRLVPTGYSVVYVPLTADGAVNIDADVEPIALLKHAGPGAEWFDGFRPVDVGFDLCGRLLVSSDGSNNGSVSKVVRVESTTETYTPPPEIQWKGPIRSMLDGISGIFWRIIALFRNYIV